MKIPACSAILLVTLVSGLMAADGSSAPDPMARLAEARKLIDGLKPRQGEITLGNDVAKAVLPPSLRYLDPADTETVLTKIWGNPRGKRTLGMLVPANFDALSRGSWAVIISYEEDGYVKDGDAAKIDYAKLLSEMKDGTREASKERVKEGYPAIELIGWAAPPRYDTGTKKLYWAKEVQFGDSPEHTLNYNIRMLGRRGVLVLNAVAGMTELKVVEAATPAILAAVNFQPGQRYEDFKEGSDKVAAYGIAALVAGGIAAKAGFFKLLWVGILAFKKVIIVGVIALAGVFKKFWAKLRGARTGTAVTPPSAPGL